jgi:integrase
VTYGEGDASAVDTRCANSSNTASNSRVVPASGRIVASPWFTGKETGRFTWFQTERSAGAPGNSAVRSPHDGQTIQLMFSTAPMTGTFQEPLFLTHKGTGFTYFGWTKRNQLLRRDLEKAGIRDFVQYRSRGYAAKRLQKSGVPLQVIMQVGGWKREAMPTRYIGKYDEGELLAFPTADLRSLLRGA